MWGAVLDRARVARAAGAGLDAPASRRSGGRTPRGGHQAVETRPLADAKKNAEIQGQTIVFVDESGLSQRPHRVRTWAPRGQTPVLQFHFNWKTLSLMAGITWWNFYFRLFPGSIKAPQIVEFLTHLIRHVRRPLLVIWDGLPGHRSRDVRDFVRAQGGRLTLEVLPAYAPELNPVEQIWSYLKQHELPNLCPRELWHLSDAARGALRRMRRRPTLVRAFWKQAGLFDDCHYVM
jgi:transposase